MSSGFVRDGLSTEVHILLRLGAIDLVVEEIWHFQIVMWLQNWSVTWLFWGLFMLSKHLVKFGVHRSCESGDIVLFATWPLGQCVTWLCGWSPLILSHHPAKFGVHRPCESGDITFFICHVTTISKCHVTLWVGSSPPKWPPC